MDENQCVGALCLTAAQTRSQTARVFKEPNSMLVFQGGCDLEYRASIRRALQSCNGGAVEEPNSIACLYFKEVDR